MVLTTVLIACALAVALWLYYDLIRSRRASEQSKPYGIVSVWDRRSGTWIPVTPELSQMHYPREDAA